MSTIEEDFDDSETAIYEDKSKVHTSMPVGPGTYIAPKGVIEPPKDILDEEEDSIEISDSIMGTDEEVMRHWRSGLKK